MGLPTMQGQATWPRNVHASSEEGRYDLALNDGLFDNRFDFMLSDPTIPDGLSCRSTDLGMMVISGQLVPKMKDKISG